jgi:GNAT superfamily N-acetyltransferase
MRQANEPPKAGCSAEGESQLVFAELDWRIESEIELLQFGLMPQFIGQGLGRYFLQWTIDKAWSYLPRRFWLHTGTKDHPAALPNYLKAGFTVYKEEVKD